MDHKETIRSITEQIRNRPRNTQVSLVRQGISHKVPNTRSTASESYKIYLGKLDRILDIDAKNLTCTAESGVTFADLVKETLKHGLVPYTVPELKTITIGGAVSGCSVESMSYKYGGFHDSCLEYEVISANGETITCNLKKNTELFQMLHGSFGTLGIITKITMKLCPAKPYVRLKYLKYDTLAEFTQAVRKEYESPQFDFMDGIIHSPKHFTLCLGRFAEEAPYTNNYDGMKIYYRSTHEREEDYLPTADYFFRYDRECHWISRNYGLENPLIRAFFGRWFLSSTNMLKTAKKLRFIFSHLKPEVIVDVFIPISRFTEFYEFYEKEYNYFPLWVVPYRIPKNKYPWINNKFMEGVTDELFMDCAIYGLRQKSGKDYYHLMDEKLLELKGIKTLISHNSYDQKTFWRIYNRENYNRAKSVTDPENIFRDLYQKTHGK